MGNYNKYCVLKSEREFSVLEVKKSIEEALFNTVPKVTQKLNESLLVRLIEI